MIRLLFVILVALSCIEGDVDIITADRQDDDHVFAIDGFQSSMKQLTHGNKMELKLRLGSNVRVSTKDRSQSSSRELNTSTAHISLNDSSSIISNYSDSFENRSITTRGDNLTRLQSNSSYPDTLMVADVADAATITSSINLNATTINVPTNSSTNSSSSWRYFMFDSIDDPEITTEFKRNFSVVAFYNLYAGDVFYHDIVKSQQSRISANKLLLRLDVVYYATMGKNGAHLPLGDKYKHIIHYGNHGEEVQTLTLLYRFCGVNPTAKVLYFHDKGSLHNDYNNAKFCNLLNCFVLTPYCIDALDDHDICGEMLPYA